MTHAIRAFHHPVAFWAGCALLCAGVLAHGPMFLAAAPMHYRLVGMPMSPLMLTGMAMIPAGLLLGAYGLLPRLARMRQSAPEADVRVVFAAPDELPLSPAHWTLVLVLIVALTVDVMKPATLGFVIPGMKAEYRIDDASASTLVLLALTGTAVGSVLWGRMADICGRRAAILLSALMFIGTAICGAMPAFGWNLAMCFLMGLSAGGLLPIAFTLMAECVPAKHRGWLLVALGGIGTSAGYLVAAGAATVLAPQFSWRSLWLLGLPTGALILVLNRWIPESPRFLARIGLPHAARQVASRFGGGTTAVSQPGRPVVADTPSAPRRLALIRAGLCGAGVAWGLANFGFVLWLPVNLIRLGVDAHAADALLARSALLALPGTLLVVRLYQRWSTIRSLVLFAALTATALLAFVILLVLHVTGASLMAVATAALLVSSSGVIAMLIPYAAEIHPVHSRGSGAGLVAGSSKLGGILGAGLGLFGFFGHMVASALLIAVAMALAAGVLARAGVETRGRPLDEIQTALAANA